MECGFNILFPSSREMVLIGFSSRFLTVDPTAVEHRTPDKKTKTENQPLHRELGRERLEGMAGDYNSNHRLLQRAQLPLRWGLCRALRWDQGGLDSASQAFWVAASLYLKLSVSTGKLGRLVEHHWVGGPGLMVGGDS